MLVSLRASHKRYTHIQVQRSIQLDLLDSTNIYTIEESLDYQTQQVWDILLWMFQARVDRPYRGRGCMVLLNFREKTHENWNWENLGPWWWQGGGLTWFTSPPLLPIRSTTERLEVEIAFANLVLFRLFLLSVRWWKKIYASCHWFHQHNE